MDRPDDSCTVGVHLSCTSKAVEHPLNDSTPVVATDDGKVDAAANGRDMCSPDSGCEAAGLDRSDDRSAKSDQVTSMMAKAVVGRCLTSRLLLQVLLIALPCSLLCSAVVLERMADRRAEACNSSDYYGHAWGGQSTPRFDVFGNQTVCYFTPKSSTVQHHAACVCFFMACMLGAVQALLAILHRYRRTAAAQHAHESQEPLEELAGAGTAECMPCKEAVGIMAEKAEHDSSPEGLHTDGAGSPTARIPLLQHSRGRHRVSQCMWSDGASAVLEAALEPAPRVILVLVLMAFPAATTVLAMRAAAAARGAQAAVNHDCYESYRGCAAAGGVSAVELQWPYEGAVPADFPLGFLNTSACTEDLRYRTQCPAAAVQCMDDMLQCAYKPTESEQEWRTHRATSAAATEALFTVAGIAVVPCTVFACILLAVPFLPQLCAALTALCGVLGGVLRGLHAYVFTPRAVDDALSPGPQQAASDAGAEAPAWCMRAMHAAADAAARAGVPVFAQWPSWSPQQRTAARDLLLGTTLPVVLLSSFAYSSSLLIFVRPLGAWQLESCEATRFHIPAIPVCHKIQVARRVQLGLGWAYAVVVLLLVVPCHRLTVRCMRPYQRPLALSMQALSEEASGEASMSSTTTVEPPLGGVPRPADVSPPDGEESLAIARQSPKPSMWKSPWSSAASMRRRLRPSWPACLLLAIPATLLAVLVVLHVVTNVRHSAGKSACYAEYRECVAGVLEYDPTPFELAWPTEDSLPRTFLRVWRPPGSPSCLWRLPIDHRQSAACICEAAMWQCGGGWRSHTIGAGSWGREYSAWSKSIMASWIAQAWLQCALALVAAPAVVVAYMLGVRTSLLHRAWRVIELLHEHGGAEGAGGDVDSAGQQQELQGGAVGSSPRGTVPDVGHRIEASADMRTHVPNNEL